MRHAYTSKQLPRFRIERYSTMGWTWYARNRKGVLIDYDKSNARGRIAVYRWPYLGWAACKSKLYQNAVCYYPLGTLRERLHP